MFEFRGLVGLAPALGGPGALGWAQDVGGALRSLCGVLWASMGALCCSVLFCAMAFFYFFWIGFALLRCCVVGASSCLWLLFPGC